MTYLQKLDAIISETIAPAAPATDRDAVFPRTAVRALGEAGLLGLVSATDVGGLGLGLPEAAQVVERIAKAAARHRCRTPPDHAGLVRHRLAQPLLGARRHGPR